MIPPSEYLTSPSGVSAQPKKVGDSKKLTLQEMYDLHLVLKMKDKDGKPCDTKKSYVGYSDHSIGANGRKNIYVSAFDPILGMNLLEDITDEKELAMVREVLKEMDNQSRK